MLSKDKKVNTELFNKILQKGAKKYFKYFYVVYLKDSNNLESHIVCVAPKKQFKLAVQRNSIKRKCYLSLESFYSQIPSSLNLLIFLKKEIKEIDSSELKKELENILKI